jgi:lipoate-protein ligase A
VPDAGSPSERAAVETRLARCPRVDYHGLHCRAWDDRQFRGAQQQVSVDECLLDIVSQRRQPALLRLWRNRHCLVASYADRCVPGFGAAVRRLAQDGITVALRRSGGTVVPQGDGVLNLSLAYRLADSQRFSIAAAYARLLGPLIRMLRADGMPATIGEVPEAFCNGRYDLVLGGGKLAGTAQRVRRAEHGVAVPWRTTRVSDHQHGLHGPEAVDRFAHRLLQSLGQAKDRLEEAPRSGR